MKGLIMSERQFWKLSASSISAFKACPMRFYLGYVCNLAPVEESVSQRVGNRWHRSLEILRHPAGVCKVCAGKSVKNIECDFCHGTDIMLEDRMAAVVSYLNRAYISRPDTISEQDWLVERATILYAVSGYLWKYENSPYKVVATELKFSLPLTNPETGAKLPDVSVVGKIDEILTNTETSTSCIGEHKSTSKGVGGDSTYWDNLRLASQPSVYVVAARQLQADGMLKPYGISDTDPLISGCMFDVFHKPGISQKELSQADTRAFMESGEYCGQKFKAQWDDLGMTGLMSVITVDNVPATMTPGKKEGTFSIRETPDMFGARLLADIAERPDFYFAQREIARTDRDLEQFYWQMYDLYQTARNMDKHDAWYTNESQCEATFRCPFTNICYAGTVVDKITIPTGYVRKGEQHDKAN